GTRGASYRSANKRALTPVVMVNRRPRNGAGQSAHAPIHSGLIGAGRTLVIVGIGSATAQQGQSASDDKQTTRIKHEFLLLRIRPPLSKAHLRAWLGWIIPSNADLSPNKGIV